MGSGMFPSPRWSYYSDPDTFGYMEVNAEWVYTQEVNSYDAKYGSVSTRVPPVGGEILPAELNLQLGQVILIASIVALGTVFLLRRKSVI